jgi:hypothetical protein
LAITLHIFFNLAVGIPYRSRTPKTRDHTQRVDAAINYRRGMSFALARHVIPFNFGESS